MPELPEVETICRGLNKKIKGKIFRGVEVKVVKLVSPAPAVFKKKIKGLQVLKIWRRAKVLVFNLSRNKNLLVHLKMTGQLIYQPARGKLIMGGHSFKQDLQNLPNKFSRLVFKFNDGSELFFNDLRKFGWLKLIDGQDLAQELSGFGVEPLAQEFSLGKFKEVLTRRSKMKIKSLLMDQKLIAGIGNIYADESLFQAKIKPTRQAGSLKESEIKALHQAILSILKLALKKHGTSTSNYVDTAGQPGGFLRYLKVYGRAGQECQRCGRQIKRIVLGGRGTHFCARCQQ